MKVKLPLIFSRDQVACQDRKHIHRHTPQHKLNLKSKVLGHWLKKKHYLPDYKCVLCYQLSASRHLAAGTQAAELTDSRDLNKKEPQPQPAPTSLWDVIGSFCHVLPHDFLYKNEPVTQGICGWISPADHGSCAVHGHQEILWSTWKDARQKKKRGKTWFELPFISFIIFSQQLRLQHVLVNHLKRCSLKEEISSCLISWSTNTIRYWLHSVCNWLKPSQTHQQYLYTSLYHKTIEFRYPHPDSSSTHHGQKEKSQVILGIHYI